MIGPPPAPESALIALTTAWIAVAAAGPSTAEAYLEALDATGFTGVVHRYAGGSLTHAWAAGEDLGGAPLGGLWLCAQRRAPRAAPNTSLSGAGPANR